jgi:hypothetical protein
VSSPRSGRGVKRSDDWGYRNKKVLIDLQRKTRNKSKWKREKPFLIFPGRNKKKMFGTWNDNDESVKKTKTTRELSLFSPVFSSWRVVMAQYYLMTCLVHVFTPVEIALIRPARQPFSSSSFFLLTHFNYSGTQSCAGSRGKKKDGRVIIIIFLLCATEFPPPL